MWTLPPHKGVGQYSDGIAYAHVSGPSVRSHMTAGQDRSRDVSSKHGVDL